MRTVKAGTVDVSVVIRIVDSTDGTPELGVVAATSGLVLQYRRELAANVSLATITDLAALTTAHTDKGMLHIGNGYYRLDLVDAACAAGVTGVLIHGIATGMVVIGEYIELVAYDPADAVRLGLTALPNAAAEAAGGLYTRGTGAGQINQPANGMVDINAVRLLGTAYATPTVAGVQEVDVTHLLGTAWLAPGTAGTPDVNVKLWNALTTVALPLIPTVAGRTLDVSAGGEAGVDWANVGSQSTAVNLSATTINLVNTVTTLTNLPAITANWLTAAGTAADFGTEIAAAVWNEDATGHQTQGSFGQAIGDPVADTNTIYKAVVTDAAGATVGVDVVAVKADTAAIYAIVNSGTFGNSALNDAIALIKADTFFMINTGVQLLSGSIATLADAVWDEDATAHQTQGSFGRAIGDPVADTDSIWGLVNTNLDAAVSSRASQTSVDDVPTNTELATALGTADDAVLAQVALVKAKTDNLPSDPADASVIAARFDTLDTSVGDLPTNTELTTALGTADDAILTQIALVKAATDLITSARMGALTDWIDGGRLDLLLDATKAKTDQLAFTNANKIDAAVLAVADLADAVGTKVAAILLRLTMASVEAHASGEAVNVSSLYGFIQQAQESAVVGSNLVVKKTDGATTLGTKPLTTTAGVDPVTGVS